MDATFRVVHAAMVRQQMDVPRHYDAFLDVLAGPARDGGRGPRAAGPYPAGSLGHLAVAVAIRVGSGPRQWLEDPRATATAVELILEEVDRKTRAARR